MMLLLSQNEESRRFSRTAAFCEKEKPRVQGPAALVVFQVNPSKTQSGSPCAHEYYDAKYEKQAAGKRLTDH
ncbi:MAG: hypothetical protein KJ936_06545 [Proteobacteria bacterium]|nr:hypothetical protein [Pseudomonadota bacterium]MBU2261197.1 hypothetical protein [Pseudomonadota bacterium]